MPKAKNSINRPYKKWKSGAFELALWLNEAMNQKGEKIEFKSLSLSRNYKKKDEDIWRNEVLNLRRQDLHKLQLMLNKAAEELFLEGENNE